MITVKTDLLSYISIEGHAGYAPAGSDIVCAAVSTLYETLKRALPKCVVKAITENEKVSVIKITPDPIIRWREEEEARDYLNFFLTGIEALEQAYPQHVQLYRAIKRA